MSTVREETQSFSPKRVLLKLSGEALSGGNHFGIDPKMLRSIAGDISQLMSLGYENGHSGRWRKSI